MQDFPLPINPLIFGYSMVLAVVLTFYGWLHTRRGQRWLEEM